MGTVAAHYLQLSHSGFTPKYFFFRFHAKGEEGAGNIHTNLLTVPSYGWACDILCRFQKTRLFDFTLIAGKGSFTDFE